MESTQRGRAESRVCLNPSARQEQRPDADMIRAACPVCGSDIVSQVFYVQGRGYVIFWICWEFLQEVPSCDYRRAL